MSGFELVAALVRSLAWPLVVLVAAILFRHQIAALLARPLASFKAGPLEFNWDREIAEVKAELGQPPSPTNHRRRRTPRGRDLADLARTDPGLAVMQAFVRVERHLRQILHDAGHDYDTLSAVPLARHALDAGLVQPETVRAIEGLSVLRNLASHGQADDLDEARALDYIALTEAVVFALGQKREKSTDTD